MNVRTEAEVRDEAGELLGWMPMASAWWREGSKFRFWLRIAFEADAADRPVKAAYLEAKQWCRSPHHSPIWCLMAPPTEIQKLSRVADFTPLPAAPRRNSPPRAETARHERKTMHNSQSPRADDESIEQEIVRKGLTAPRVTPADIEANIASEHYFTAADGVVGAFTNAQVSIGRGVYPDEIGKLQEPLTLLTFYVLTLQNGFTVVGKSACASPENFDAELGRKIARADAVNQLWPLMGYALKERLAGAETKVYTDGTSVTGTPPLPEHSPTAGDGGILDGSNRTTSGAIGQP